MNWWRFPPPTRKGQLDEKRSFVTEEQKHGTAEELFAGDRGDHVALAPDGRLVPSVVVGKRTPEDAELLPTDVRARLGGRVPAVVTRDEDPADPEALLAAFGEAFTPPRTGRPGRGVFGGADGQPPASTSYLERQNATDRHRTARKGRKTDRFSKDWEFHAALTMVTMYGDNFCWPVRTLRVKGPGGHWQPRPPAMAAGLADHPWTLDEWLTLPSVQRE
jgi:hypothetical protein